MNTIDNYFNKISTFDILEDNSKNETTPITYTLGILGNSSASYWNSDTIQEILEAILEDQEKNPEQILIPSDGITSLLIEVISGKKKIPKKVYSADFRTLGRRAGLLRDTQIIKESTHLLVFLGLRSDKYEKIAIRELKKGKVVFTIDAKTHELAKWEL